MELGYIGLGAMGAALARRLLLKRPLRVHDLDPARVSELAALGGTPVQSVAALARACDMIMTCLPTSADVASVVEGEDGLAAHLHEGAIVADMTTGDPNVTRSLATALAGRGIAFIDAPVSGGPAGAHAGTIAIMVGATASQFERVRPVFESISPNVFHCGETGAGHTMKLVNNMMAAGLRALSLEAAAMGIANGLSLERISEVVQAGTGRSYVTEVTFPKLAKGWAPVNFRLGLMLKDVALATRTGAAANVAMPLCSLVEAGLRSACVEHGPGADLNRAIDTIERLTGVAIVPAGAPAVGDEK